MDLSSYSDFVFNFKIRINVNFEVDFTKKVNVKKQRRFDR